MRTQRLLILERRDAKVCVCENGVKRHELLYRTHKVVCTRRKLPLIFSHFTQILNTLERTQSRGANPLDDESSASPKRAINLSNERTAQVLRCGSPQINWLVISGINLTSETAAADAVNKRKSTNLHSVDA